jgi:hypothetical protein
LEVGEDEQRRGSNKRIEGRDIKPLMDGHIEWCTMQGGRVRFEKETNI